MGTLVQGFSNPVSIRYEMYRYPPTTRSVVRLPDFMGRVVSAIQQVVLQPKTDRSLMDMIC